MNDQIITEIANDLGVKKHQVEVVLTLLSEGNTIPFIARYRKEATGALDEEEIRKINEVYEYQVNLLKRLHGGNGAGAVFSVFLCFAVAVGDDIGRKA